MIQGRRLFSTPLFALTLGLATVLESTAAQASAPPGASLTGELSVTPGGSASYQLPLLTPPGKIKPSLSLQYSSQGGNGPLGMGWSLGGLSQLSRCPRVKTIDGIDDGLLQFNANDRLCLDGQRLILVSGTYGGNNAEYRTQIDSGLKIVGKGAFSSATTWFEVRSQDGQITEYGRSTDSRRSIAPNGGSIAVPTVWAMNKVSDRFSNYYTVSYLQDGGMLYPQTISYAGNTQAGTTPQRTLSLIWEAERPDVIPVYVGGGVSASIQRRLTGMTNNANPARYRLNYSASEAGLSQLTKVEYCPDGSTTNCLKVESEYGTDAHPTTGKRTSDPALVLAALGANQSWGSHDRHPRVLADVNGNGKLDIVAFSDNGVFVAYATETGFSAPVNKLSNFDVQAGWSSNTTHPRMVVDINGDGMADIVGFGHGGVWVALSTGTGFTPPTIWVNGYGTGSGWHSQDSHPRMLADVDGDGLLDVVGFANGSVNVALNKRTLFQASTAYSNITTVFTPNTGWNSNNKFPRMMADVNGDGRDDIVGFGPNGVMVALAGQNGFQIPTVWSSDYKPESNTVTEEIDNGWGFILHNMRTENAWHTQSMHPRLLADMNGDGLPDIVGVSHKSSYSYNSVILTYIVDNNPDIYFSPNTGTSFLPQRLIQTGGDGASNLYTTRPDGNLAIERLAATYTLADVNQDGRGDIVIHQGPCTSFRPAINSPLGLALGPDECLVNGFTQENGNWTDQDERIIADVHGKGVVDVLGFSPAGVVISRGQAKNPHQIVKFRDDLTESTITYATLTDSGVYTKGTGATFPVSELQVPMTVVKSLNQPDGLGVLKSINYKYGGLRSHFDYGSLGFNWLQSTNVLRQERNTYEQILLTSIIDHTEFHQNFPLTGMIFRSQSKLCQPGFIIFPWNPPPEDCRILAQEVSDWSVTESGTTSARKVYRPHITKTTEHSWDASGAPVWAEMLGLEENPHPPHTP